MARPIVPVRPIVFLTLGPPGHLTHPYVQYFDWGPTDLGSSLSVMPPFFCGYFSLLEKLLCSKNPISSNPNHSDEATMRDMCIKLQGRIVERWQKENGKSQRLLWNDPYTIYGSEAQRQDAEKQNLGGIIIFFTTF